MKNNNKNNIQNLESINLCFISENPWLKNFAKKTQCCRFVVRMKHGFNKWSFKFHFCNLQISTISNGVSWFSFFLNAFIRVESVLTPLDKNIS